MGLGGATKKLQKVADMGEELYGKMNELREQMLEVRQTVSDTHQRVATIENKLDQQGAILEALAEQEGVDVEEILTDVAIEEAEPAVTETTDGGEAAGGATSGSEIAGEPISGAESEDDE